MTTMPGRSVAPGSLAPPSPRELALQQELRTTVNDLAGTIGERNVDTSGSLDRTRNYLVQQLELKGYEVQLQDYYVSDTTCTNIIVEIPGTERNEILVVGGHYDSVFRSPGADDNASGTAAVLALARSFAGSKGTRTVRFVFFVNEEAPFALTPKMGSFVYASSCRKRGEKIIGMMSLESLGYFSDEPGSQQYPSEAFKTLYPSTGNFIAFVGDPMSRPFVRRALEVFRRIATVPSEGAVLPRRLAGVGWSDHWSFWVHGYPGMMVTCTAPFRNPNYHTPGDLPDTLDYDRMARVVAGLEHVLQTMLNP